MVTQDLSVLVMPLGPGSRRSRAGVEAALGDARRAGVRVVCVLDRATPWPGLMRLADELLQIERGNSYAARNAGTEIAVAWGATTVLFLDADCIPVTAWPRHTLEHLERADLVSVCARPLGHTVVGRRSRSAYADRFRAWHQASSCGEPASSFDTRAAGVRVEVLRQLRFEERLRHAGDAWFGRQAATLGFSVVACFGDHVAHEDPESLFGELRKNYLTARKATVDIRALPRRDLIAFLPEYAHLRLRPSAKDRVVRLLSTLHAGDGEPGVARAEAREDRWFRSANSVAWQVGWWSACR